MGRHKRAQVENRGNPSHMPDLSHPAQDDEDILPHMPDLSHPTQDNEDILPHMPNLPDPALNNEHTPDLPDPTQDDKDILPHMPNLPDPAQDDKDILPHMPDLPDPALDNGDNRPCRPDCQSPGDHGNTPFPFSFEYECRACPSIDIEALAELAILPLMQHNMQFILALKNMSLKDPASKLTSKAIEKIQNPPSHADPINDPGTHFSTSTYLALENASQLAYNRVCQAAQCHTPKFGDVSMDPMLNDEEQRSLALMCRMTGMSSSHPSHKNHP
ncbi:hypothetical protein BKA83DRAFT_4496658 [Pisolithus microcarpus]|nr:hypothetical protein BKA83DRAFT_4496658 [Pisolithus microcarpus]